MSWLDLELDKSVGSTNMQRAASNNRVLTDSSSFNQLTELGNRVRQDGLYQRLTWILTKSLHTKQAVFECTERLVTIADQAYATRQLDTVGHVAKLLFALCPTGDVESAGKYYE